MSNQDDTLPSTEYLLKEAIFEAMKEVHTMLPGIIDTFDGELLRAKITLTNAIELEDGTVIEMPPLINVPVQFPRWGDYLITMPVKKGDECAIFFSERSLERFLEIGDTGKPPNSTRFHDLSDGFAVMGLSSKLNKIGAFANDAMEIRDKDGSKKIKLTDSGEIELDNGNGITITLKGTGVKILNSSGELVDLISQTLQQLSIETVIISSGSSAGTYSLTGAAIYTALKTLVDSFRVA